MRRVTDIATGVSHHSSSYDMLQGGLLYFDLRQAFQCWLAVNPRLHSAIAGIGTFLPFLALTLPTLISCHTSLIIFVVTREWSLEASSPGV